MKKLLIPVCFYLLHSMTCPLFSQWTLAQLSTGKAQMGVTSLGAKAYFAGGNSAGGPTNKVEIYNSVTGAITSKTLSVPRAFPAAAGVGNKVLFAGGINWDNLNNYATVDILDTLTLQWTSATLSVPRTYIQAVTIGNEVLFAGGFKVVSNTPLTHVFTSNVDVYNNATGTWSTKTLSQARAAMGAAVSGNIAVFAGGQISGTQVSDRVDIYNSSTGVWTTATLSEARAFCAATSVGNKIIIAGGVTNSGASSDRVDIYDTQTGQWTSSSLSVPRSFTTMGASICGKAYFAGGGNFAIDFFAFQNATNRVDIYDPVTNTWSEDMLQNGLVNHSVVSVKNQLLVGGGVIFPGSFNKKIEILTCTPTTGISEEAFQAFQVSLSPNPIRSSFSLRITSNDEPAFRVEVFSTTGQLIAQYEAQAQTEQLLETTDWAPGAYMVRVIGKKSMAVKQVFKI